MSTTSAVLTIYAYSVGVGIKTRSHAAALIFPHLLYLIRHNLAENKEKGTTGVPWCTVSVRGLVRQYHGVLSKSTMSRALHTLIEHGFVVRKGDDLTAQYELTLAPKWKHLIYLEEE